MPLDLNALKQRLLGRSAKQDVPVMDDVAKPQKKGLSNNALVVGFKQQFAQGISDVKAVMDEGNYKLFAKQVVVVLCVFFGVRYLVGKVDEQKAQKIDRASVISIQQTNEDDYLGNKNRLLRLEPLFPESNKKNEWMVQRLMKLFGDRQIQGNINGNATEKAEESYTIISQDISFQQPFAGIGKFMEDVENGDDFLRISGFTISKVGDANQLGQNAVTMKLNTLFPKEKFAKRLFKDYDKQIKQIAAENAAASSAATQAQPTAGDEGGAHAS